MRLALLAVTVTTLAAALHSRGADEPANWSMATRLYGDHKAYAVGDILTIRIVEESSATKDAQASSDSKTTMGGGASVGRPQVDNRPTSWTNAVLPAYSLDVTRSFAGGGSVQNKDKFSSTISARVTEVLPNGNLLIEGKRTVVIQNEDACVVLTGTVRPRDISGDNTVISTSIADATIRYSSSGPIVNNQTPGLFTRILNWLNPL
jgi:flagellar L-ring protein precursor FlgH